MSAQSRRGRWEVLDDEEVVCHSPGVASEPVVLEPHAGVGVPVVPWHIGRSAEARRELHVVDALAKSPWTPLVRRPDEVAVVIAVVAPPAFTIIVVALTVVAVVVDALGPPSGLDGVSYVAVRPEAAPGRRSRGSASLPALSMLGRRRIRAMCEWCSRPPAFRALA
jgi:hypothetical protein